MPVEQGLVLRRPSLSSVTWWLVVLVGLPLFVAAVVLGGPDLGMGGPALGMTAALLLVLELRPIIASGRYDPQGVTLSTAFVFAMLFMWGLWPAIIAQSLATLAVAARIPVGRRPWGIALSRDGRWLVTANGLSNDVSLVDTRARREVAKVKVGTRPWGVAVLP